MGPKKGKGSKLARMSDEERARYLQHRAAIEEEARRRKEQLIATFMKNKLKKEEAFARLNAAKINQEWRQTLRVLKCTELKQDLEALFSWFDHAASKKTNLIESLLEDLEEAECQYSRIHQCHMEAVDKLLLIYNQRISQLQGMYEIERDRMLDKARSNIDSIISSAVADHEHLNAIIFRTQQTSDEDTAGVIDKHNARIDELRNSMLTEVENIVNFSEARMETYWKNLQSVLHDHWLQTEDRRREYLNLRNADAENCQQIFHYHQQISAVNEMLQSLKTQLANVISSGEERIKERKAEKTNCTELFHVLRRKLFLEKETDHKKLCRMTVVADSSTKRLENILRKGQQILQLLNLCRKYETLDEKVCPAGFVKSQLPEESEHSNEEELSAFEEPLAEEAFNKYKKLDGFWQRYNKVVLEKEALNLQYQTLLIEQKQIKSVLRHYFSEFSSAPSSPPKAPLQIRRPASYHQGFRPISLVGERVLPRSGKTLSCSDSSHSPSFVHTLTIELTKP